MDLKNKKCIFCTKQARCLCSHGLPFCEKHKQEHNGPTGLGGGQVGILGPIGISSSYSDCIRCLYHAIVGNRNRYPCDRYTAERELLTAKHTCGLPNYEI